MKKNTSDARVAIISAVKTYLGFYALLLLVVEASLGAVALKADPGNQRIIIIGMILIFLGLMTVVSLFAYFKPEPLLQTVTSQQKLQKFVTCVSGCWWQTLAPDEPCALSVVIINPGTTINSLKLDGWAYNRRGELVTYWETEMGLIDLTEEKVIYAWKRKRSSLKYEPYAGFGEISFHEPLGEAGAEGFFLDINYSDLASTKKFSAEYARPEVHEQKIMLDRNMVHISDLVQKKLSDKR